MLKQRIRLLLFLVAGAGLLLGCARAKTAPSPEQPRTLPGIAVEGEVMAPAGEAKTATVADEMPALRMIVYEGYMELRVENPKEALDQAWRITEELGGYVVSSDVSEASLPDGRTITKAHLVVRVPAQRLQEARERFRSLALEVLKDTLNSEDVTAEYVDIEARLRHLRATEKELLKFLEEARTTEEVLEVYRHLRQVREDIERLEGRKRYLQQVSKFARLELQFVPKEVQPPVLPGVWTPKTTLQAALRALIRTLQVLADLAIWLVVYFLPLFLIFAALAWVGYRVLRWGYRRFFRPEDRGNTPPPASRTTP